MKRKIGLLGALGLMAFLVARTPDSADAVLERMEGNLSFKTASFGGEAIITSKGRVAVKTFFAYLEGRERFFLEYTAPARDRGQRLLRGGDGLFLYLPSARKVLRVGKKRQRRLESTFVLDDIIDMGGNLRGRFSAELHGEEAIAGRPCDVLRLTALQPGQTYATRQLWVDQETAVALRTLFFTRSGMLARELTASGIRSFGERFYPTRLVMADRLRRQAETEIVLSRIVFDGPLPPGIFDPGNLAPKRADRQAPGR